MVPIVPLSAIIFYKDIVLLSLPLLCLLLYVITGQIAALDATVVLTAASCGKKQQCQQWKNFQESFIYIYIYRVYQLSAAQRDLREEECRCAKRAYCVLFPVQWSGRQ